MVNPVINLNYSNNLTTNLMLILLFFVLLFLFLSAFFSGSETSLTSSSKAKIHKLRMEGNVGAEKIGKLMDNKERLITTILLGNTFVNVAISALVTTIIIELFGNNEQAIYLTTFFLTVVILIFGEVLPKSYALNNPEKLALVVAPIFIFVVKILYPFTYLVEKLVRFFTKIFRIQNHQMSNLVQGLDAIRGALELHHEQGEVVKEDKDMLGGILDLEHIEVSEIMKHRRDIEIANIKLPTKDFIDKILKSPHSRIPVYENTPDNIIGVMHTKSLMRAVNSNESGNLENIDLKPVLNTAYFIPETTTLKEQLLAFRSKKYHLALVVDEYGTLMGLLTLEDILEEIVGNIEDETDIKHHMIEEKEDGTFIVQGNINIRDLNREMSWDLPTEEANTIAGLLIYNTEMIPAVGQVFNFFGFRFEVLKKKKNQILKVKISPPTEEALD
ncbi:MAG TPA: hypothetical protein DIV86_04280 [Alphaproteobacteria bacterium]|nr:hypothetical protein [Alphaproteobacteria bacterium]